jgi:hypothetical protein
MVPFTVITNQPSDGGVGWYVTIWDPNLTGLTLTVYAICVNASQSEGGAVIPDQPDSSVNIAGRWTGGSTRIDIRQTDASLDLSVGGQTFSGHFENPTTIWVGFSETCCRGTLSNNYTRIDWSNGTFWTKGDRSP